MSYRMPIRASQDCRWNEKAVENGEAHRNSFPSPITSGRNCARHDHEGSANRDRRPNTEKTETGAYADELRHQSQKVAEHQVAHGEKAPELPETIEDQFSVTPVRDGSQAHRHFLHDKPHQERQNDKWYEKSDSVPRTVCRVGKHARSVVLAEKDEDSRPDQKPEQAYAAEFLRSAALSPGASHLPPVPSAVHILMSQKGCEFGRCRGSGGGFRGWVRVDIWGSAGIVFGAVHGLT